MSLTPNRALCGSRKHINRKGAAVSPSAICWAKNRGCGSYVCVRRDGVRVSAVTVYDDLEHHFSRTPIDVPARRGHHPSKRSLKTHPSPDTNCATCARARAHSSFPFELSLDICPPFRSPRTRGRPAVTSNERRTPRASVLSFFDPMAGNGSQRNSQVTVAREVGPPRRRNSKSLEDLFLISLRPFLGGGGVGAYNYLFASPQRFWLYQTSLEPS